MDVSLWWCAYAGLQGSHAPYNHGVVINISKETLKTIWKLEEDLGLSRLCINWLHACTTYAVWIPSTQCSWVLHINPLSFSLLLRAPQARAVPCSTSTLEHSTTKYFPVSICLYCLYVYSICKDHWLQHNSKGLNWSEHRLCIVGDSRSIRIKLTNHSFCYPYAPAHSSLIFANIPLDTCTYNHIHAT
jgi:hypothetical protein